MAKKRRTKASRTIVTKKGVSRAERDYGYIAAKKMLRHFDLDPTILDIFTKRHRQMLFSMAFEMPTVKAEREKTVPRQFIKTIHSEMFTYMKTNYWGDPENKFSFMELATYGMAFQTMLRICVEDGIFAGDQYDTAKLIVDKFSTEECFIDDGFKNVYSFLYMLTRGISQFNFRMYGFNYKWEDTSYNKTGFTNFKLRIYITAHDCETKMITHNNIKRKAFRLILTDYCQFKPIRLFIPKNKIFPKASSNEIFNLYIQSHVLSRFKERMDVFEPQVRNLIIQNSLSIWLNIISTEKQSYFMCSVRPDTPAGYFTFFISGDDLVINTFIPLMNEHTPEGSKLFKLLKLSKDETVYLGMDKMSFLFDVDFDQIPVLKQALINSGIWKLKLAIQDMFDDAPEFVESSIDEIKTMFVKNFFEKRDEYI